jgi:protein-S-isoprenylcysteine O-methyltransferase Ste14
MHMQKYFGAVTLALLLAMVLLFSNLIPLLYLAAATWLFHRQVLREEEFMRRHYG